MSVVRDSCHHLLGDTLAQGTVQAVLILGITVSRSPTTIGPSAAEESLHLLTVLGKVDVKVGRAGKSEQKVTDVGHPGDPGRPGYGVRVVVLKARIKIIKLVDDHLESYRQVGLDHFINVGDDLDAMTDEKDKDHVQADLGQDYLPPSQITCGRCILMMYGTCN